MRSATFKLLLAAMLAVSIVPARAQTAHDIVARADEVRNPSKPFRIGATVTEYRSGQAADKNVFTVYSKLDPETGQFRDLMIYAEPPRDAGKALLLNRDNLWFYDPASKQSVRISPQEKLTGEASAGDVMTENLAVDYASEIVGSDTVEHASRQERSCWHLLLRASRDAATYNHVDYWVEKASYFPVKAKLYADSGALLKVLYYRNFIMRGGHMTPEQAVIIDAVDATLVTTVDLAEPQFQDIPDAWFQRDYLPHLSLN